MTPKSGRVIAWLSFLLGIGVSIAGNIGHAASDGMRPGEWAGAAFWPTALMLTIEILTRVKWQPEKRWIVARIAGLFAVAIVAAVLSYWHLRGLMIYWGEEAWTATIGPLAVDGLMLVAATALLSISKEVPQAVDKPVGEWRPEPKPVPVPAPDEEQTSQPAPALDYSDSIAVPVESPDEVVAEPEKSKLHVVREVTRDDAEEAAFQAWIDSGKRLSSQKVAELAGLSKSTAHRRIKTWERRIAR